MWGSISLRVKGLIYENAMDYVDDITMMLYNDEDYDYDQYVRATSFCHDTLLHFVQDTHLLSYDHRP
jgi:hypothetical protein